MTPKVSIVALSGGIDSAYVLAHLLRETDDIVVAHHINMMNKEGRWLEEAKACADIVRYCKARYRHFFYTESTIDRRKMSRFGWDIMTVAAEIGVAALNARDLVGRIPHYCHFGVCAEEKPSLTCGPEAEQRMEDVIRAICFPHTEISYRRHDVRPKAECMRYMGRELSEMCWTCRTPQEGRECGACMTCELMREIQNQVSYA